MDDTLHALILGVVQGLAEWLPISSEGVITLIETEIFGRELEEALSQAIWLHIGTMLAAIFYFRVELQRLVPQIPTWIFRPHRMNPDDKVIANFLGISTIVTGVIGAPLLIFSLGFEIPGGYATGIIGLLLIGTGLFQLFAPRLGSRTSSDANLLDAVISGLLQGLASLPGLSRSGLTVTTLLMRGFSETEALRLSFLMSIPVIFGAQVLLQFIMSLENISFEWRSAFVGMISAAIVGWLTIEALMRIARKLPFWAFAIALGVVSLLAAFLI